MAFWVPTVSGGKWRNFLSIVKCRLTNLLMLLEHWFAIRVTCVKWGSIMSRFIGLVCGIRHGGVLSPYFFSIYIDSVVEKVIESNLGCYIK